MEFLEQLKIENEYVENLKTYREYNQIIHTYFKDYAAELNSKVLFNNSVRIRDCNKIWNINHYQELNIKEVTKTHLCKNKFCFNCKKVLQAFRMSKYSDFIRKQKNLYHLVLTVPNVSGEDLKETLKKMSKTFRRFNLIISGKDKFKIPFDLEVTGALRSLEITFSKKNESVSFHPHYHVLVALDNSIVLDKTHKNKFSFDNLIYLKRLFSDIELYFQKLWYCLYNSIHLSKIKDIDIGYSVILDEFKEEDFIELFKYMCKEKAFVDEDSVLLDYETFKYLYDATYRVKQLQGYGIFYNIKDDFDYEEIKEDYLKYIEYLKALDEPVAKKEFLSQKDYQRHIEKMREDGFNEDDIKSFTKNFNFVEIDKSTYISLKKYINLVKNNA